MSGSPRAVIGIDLGTTHSVVATAASGAPLTIKNTVGANLTPSVVALGRRGEWLVGDAARRHALLRPREVISASKRLIGRRYRSPELADILGRLPYEVEEGPHGEVRVRLQGGSHSIPDVASKILAELRRAAEFHFGHEVREAVITVPAYFQAEQREATRAAAEDAGLEVLQIINEPTAAALAYASLKQTTGKIAVYDMGGGTFDISVVQVGPGVVEVIASGGDALLGGEDFDAAVMKWLGEQFAEKHGAPLSDDPSTQQRVRVAAEQARKDLSAANVATIQLEHLGAGPAGPLHLTTTLTRQQLEQITSRLCDRSLEIVRSVLGRAKVPVEDIAHVVLVGGMTRMPLIAQRVAGFFGREPSRGVHPDEVVALGASILARALVDPESYPLLIDVTAHAVWLQLDQDRPLVLLEANSTIPARRQQRVRIPAGARSPVKVRGWQGSAADLDTATELELDDVRPSDEVELSVDVDASGEITLGARSVSTGRQRSVKLGAERAVTKPATRDIVTLTSRPSPGGRPPSGEVAAAPAARSASGEHAAARGSGRTGSGEVPAAASDAGGAANFLAIACRDIEALLPKVAEMTGQTTFGRETVKKATEVLEDARRRLRDSAAEPSDALKRQVTETLSLLRGIVRTWGSFNPSR